MLNAVFLDQQSLYPDDLSFADWQNLPVHWSYHANTAAEQTLEHLAHQHIVVTNKVVITEQHLDANPQIQCIVVSATGVNNVDVDAARRRNIPVCNVRAYGTSAVAQHTMALILSLSNKIGDYQQDLSSNRWANSPYFCDYHHPITELQGCTLGIVGYGELGKAVAALGGAFGMTILLARRDKNDRRPRRMTLLELAQRSDIISLHCPLTSNNQGMINRNFLSNMKPSAVLINTSRGGLVVEKDLLWALEHGVIAGAGVDVLSEEPPPAIHPLLNAKLPQLLVTPHVAWASRASRQRMADQVAHLIQAFLTGQPEHLVT